MDLAELVRLTALIRENALLLMIFAWTRKNIKKNIKLEIKVDKRKMEVNVVNLIFNVNQYVYLL